MNFYCGSEEYLIIFIDGIHHIINTTDYTHGTDGLVFTGTYAECVEKSKQMIIEYEESLL